MSSSETSSASLVTALPTVSEQHSETTAQQSRRISFEEVEKHVLVVDDDKLSRKTLSQMLQKLGFQVTTAKGGREALQLLKVNQKEGAQQASTHFQLLLVDVMMPEMDGFELLRIFKQAFTQDIPVIMISSTEDPDTITAAFNSGAEDFLQKPIRFEMLKRRVEMCLDDRARRRKETLYREMLKKEREKRNELTNRVKQQEKELEQIKSQISDTIETPMQVVMTTIGDLMNGNYSVEQYKGALVAILKSLGSRDLYRPKFSSMLEGEKLDTTTRKWLLSEFMQEQQDKLEKKKAAAQTTTHISSLRRGSTKPADLISDLQQLNSRLTPTANSIKEESPGAPIPETKLAVSQLSPTTRNAVKDIDKFTFNVFDYSIENLIEAVVAMFEELDFINQFNIDKVKLTAYIGQLRSAYHDTNPYHNFIHAIDVTQFVYCTITCSEKISSLFTPLDCLVLLIASLSHDLEHPGLNNNYQVNAKTKLALLYNDTSVLENFHSARTFQLLNDKKYNFLENLTTEDYKEFRRTIINLILATDMANHFEILTKFQTRIQTGQLSKESKDDKQQFMNVILKCADISNAVRTFDTAHKWADLLIQEFCNQGDIEREQGLPISPLMDRNSLNKPRMQINFIDYIAGPLFKTMAEYVPEMKSLVEVMSHNRAVWVKFLEKEEAAAQQNSTTTTATSLSSSSTSSSSAQSPTQAPPSQEPLYGDITGSEVAKVKGFTVLIVDNDRRFHELASKLLKTIGYADKVVTSSSETIIELEKGSYDLVLISYDLPGKEATDTIQQIQSTSSLKNIPIIGLCREENKTEATKQFAALNVSKCLAKPMEANKLVGAMEESIDLAIQNLDPVFMEQALELCGGEESFVVELLGDFIDNGVPQLKIIEDSIAAEDYKTLQLNAHSMKGAAAQLAAKPLSQAAFSLEKAAKLKYPKAQCEKLLATLKQRFVAFQQFVHNLEAK